MAVVRLGGRLRAGEVRVVSHGSRLGLFRQKCLQACVAGLIERKRHLSSRSVACWNDDRSGCCGTLRERRNFSVVQSALRLHGLFVWVYESASREALVRGELRGRWALGAAGGASAGAVVWMKREQHLVELVALEGADLDVQSWTVSGECAPWFRYVIGAPKKGVAKPKATF